MVGYPHDIKGQGIYAYVTLMAGEQPSEDLRKELVGWVRKEIGPIASPDLIQFAPGLPKTRSGKIMRRILRKIAENEFGSARRHLDAGRPGGGQRPHRQPAEPQTGLTGGGVQPHPRTGCGCVGAAVWEVGPVAPIRTGRLGEQTPPPGHTSDAPRDGIWRHRRVRRSTPAPSDPGMKEDA